MSGWFTTILNPRTRGAVIAAGVPWTPSDLSVKEGSYKYTLHAVIDGSLGFNMIEAMIRFLTITRLPPRKLYQCKVNGQRKRKATS